MFTMRKDITVKLTDLASKYTRQIKSSIHKKRIEKQKIQLQAALMSGGIRRLK